MFSHEQQKRNYFATLKRRATTSIEKGPRTMSVLPFFNHCANRRISTNTYPKAKQKGKRRGQQLRIGTIIL